MAEPLKEKNSGKTSSSAGNVLPEKTPATSMDIQPLPPRQPPLLNTLALTQLTLRHKLLVTSNRRSEFWGLKPRVKEITNYLRKLEK
ncbi:hypothetical protein RUM43_006117 [Polyplax serrata]|uniref:Uncharacterized protein n=1 Tax=Polyplax serrata TaxID=468196 RepID=A0AAN8NSL7_POLSC